MIVLPVVVDAKRTAAVIVKFVDDKVQSPNTDTVPVNDIAPSRASTPVPKLILLQTGELVQLTVKELVPVFEFLSKITSSADVGTPAPPLPPELEAQGVVEVAVQFALPPTQ